MVCPGCQARLAPVRAHSFVLYALTGAVAATVGYFIRRTDVVWWLKLAVPTATWLAGWHFIFSRFLRFKPAGETKN
ncbi:MAG: hypothetical protein HYY26_05250 [Acidobacteria bacterium]|nr:hypothetical protein [Acidobacteriota bacterium]